MLYLVKRGVEPPTPNGPIILSKSKRLILTYNLKLKAAGGALKARARSVVK